MKKHLTNLAMVLFLLSGTTLFAQEGGEKAAEAEKAMSSAGNEAWEQYMAVGEMHQLLAAGAGDWKAEVSMWESPGAAPQKSVSSCKNEMILGGRYQASTFSGMMMGMPFEGRGLVGYDNIKKVFISTWVDNMGTGLMYSEGVYDAKSSTINFKGSMMDPMSGKEVKTREVYKFVDDSHHLFEMYVMKDGKEFKTMEINYRR